VTFVIALAHHEPLAIVADAQLGIAQNVNGQILGLAPLGVIKNTFNPTFNNVIDLIPFLLRGTLVRQPFGVHDIIPVSSSGNTSLGGGHLDHVLGGHEDKGVGRHVIYHQQTLHNVT
jgi:hypothetical protein